MHQACAESKVKCNLQYPCSKCSSRGKECIFINDPEASRNKRNAKKAQRPSCPTSPPHSIPSSSALSVGPGTPFEPSPPSPLSPGSISSAVEVEYPYSTLTNFSTPTSSASSDSSPRTDIFDNARRDVPSPFDVELDALALDGHLNRLFSNTTMELFLDQQFPSCAPQSNDYTWLDSGNTFYPAYNGDAFPSTPSNQVHHLSAEYADSGLSGGNMVNPVASLATRISPPSPLGGIPKMSQQAEPAAAELEHYCAYISLSSHSSAFYSLRLLITDTLVVYSFFSDFSVQVPLLHPSTWHIEGKPYFLTRAMQACGALFVKTRTASHFVSDTLASTRDVLVYEFVSMMLG